MTDNLHTILAEFQKKGYVIAPAGYGKTHLIAMAVSAATQRQLVLTHTYAGVSSIKKKMQALAVPSSLYQVETIASWALRMCLSFPSTSKWSIEYPDGKEWDELYLACTALLERPFSKKLLENSYSGFYVDEYQDCSIQQHMLVEGIAEFLPCRLLGDPLQAIFDFANAPVEWEKHIYPYYQRLGELTKPWRWHLADAPELGEWLDSIGARLRANEQFTIQAPLPKGLTRVSVDLNDFTNRKRLNFLYKFLDNNDPVIAIYSGDQKSKNKAHKLAQALGGKFSSIEEVEGKDLFRFIKKLESAKLPGAKIILTIEFAKKCMTGVDGVLTTGTKRGEVAKATQATKYPNILGVANNYLSSATSANCLAFLQAIQGAMETCTYRRDLLNRLIKILQSNIESPEMSIMDSANIFQRDFRHAGRPIRHNKLIGTTLLVKGLEYQHAIILEADTMSPKDLYVALTRGAKTLTIVSLRMTLPS
ncbi:hypothetical protein EAH72_34020 [Pseudomonas caspiana]|nr:UvrD-helicase domain-containing protein [Pseudomonas caspiana]TPG87820.1 hypothetical protein EAH72_34020 [Pseudomonas caspiana]